MLRKPPPLKAAPRSKVVADAADAELVILDPRDHLAQTAKTEPMAKLAVPARMALMAQMVKPVEELNPAKIALQLPLAHPAALDPRDHPDQPDPLEMMLLVAEVVLPALPVPLDHQAHLEDPDQKDQLALPERSLNQLEPPAPTAVLVLLALLALMDHPVLQATLAPLALLAHLATLEPVPHPARMVHPAPRDPKAHQAEVAAATTAHRRARLPAIKPRHPATTVLMMFMIAYTPLGFA